MKDWKNTTASHLQEVQEDTTETSKWTGGFPSLNLSSLSPLSAPLGDNLVIFALSKITKFVFI